MARLYSAFDVHISTSQSEGFHLPSLEAMACGCVAMAGDWSALGDWAKDAAVLIPCTQNICTHNGINVIGGLPDRSAYVAGLEALYSDPVSRRWWAQKGLSRAHESRFDWNNIGDAFAREIINTLPELGEEAQPKPVPPKLRIIEEGFFGRKEIKEDICFVCDHPKDDHVAPEVCVTGCCCPGFMPKLREAAGG
jgi:hypothetical protein